MGGGLRHADWLTRALGWLALLGVISGATALCSLAVIQAGMLPLVQAESALGINLALSVLLISWLVQKTGQPEVPACPSSTEDEVVQSDVQPAGTDEKRLEAMAGKRRFLRSSGPLAGIIVEVRK